MQVAKFDDIVSPPVNQASFDDIVDTKPPAAKTSKYPPLPTMEETIGVKKLAQPADPLLEYAPHIKAQKVKVWDSPVPPPLTLPVPDQRSLLDEPITSWIPGPEIKIDKAGPNAGFIEKGLRGAGRSALTNARALGTPRNLGIMGGLVGANIARLVNPSLTPIVQAANATAATKFGADMMASLVDQNAAYQDAIKKGDTEAAVQALTDVGITATMAGSIVRGGIEHLRGPVEQKMGVAKPALVTPPPLTTPLAARYPNQEFIPGDAGTSSRLPVQKSAARSAKVFQEQVSIPEEGVPETVARRQAALEDVARTTTGKALEDLSPSERIAVEDLVDQGYIGAPSPRTAPLPLTTPEVVKPKSAAESAEVFEAAPPKSAAESAEVFQSRPVPGLPAPKVDSGLLRRNEMAQAVAGKDYAELNAHERALTDRGLLETKGKPVAPPPLETPTRRGVTQEVSTQKPKRILDRIGEELDSQANAALLRIQERGTFSGKRAMAGVPIDDMADLAIYGAAKIGRGAVDSTQWSAEMVKEIGPHIKPVLDKIYKQSVKAHDRMLANTVGPTPSTRRLMNLYRKGEDGAKWYNKSKSELEPIFGEDTDLFIDFLAATSPSNTVAGNVAFAIKTYKQHKQGQPFSGVMPSHSSLLDLAIKGEKFPDTAPKTQAFREALKGDPDAFTVDRWIARAYGFGDRITPQQYKYIDNALSQVARQRGIPPREFMAGLWNGIKREVELRTNDARPFEDLVKERLAQDPELKAVLDSQISKIKATESTAVPSQVGRQEVAQPGMETPGPQGLLGRLDANGKAATERLRSRGGVTSMNEFLNPETIHDMAHSIAGDVARGLLTVEQYVADMVAKYGPQIKDHAQKIWAEAQRLATDISGEDKITKPVVERMVKGKQKPIEEQYLNFDRINVSPETEAKIRQAYQEQAASGTLLPKETMSMDEVRAAAAGVTLEQAKAASEKAKDYVQNNATVMAARQAQMSVASEFTRAASEFERTKGGMTEPQRLEAEAHVDKLSAQLQEMNNVIEPLRSGAGRGLRLWKEIANATSDPTFWMREAKKSMNISPEAKLPGRVVNKIGALVGDIQAAETAINTGLREHGYSPDMEAKLKAKQEQTRSFLEKNEGNPELAEQLAQARKEYQTARAAYQRMVAKREQILSAIPQLKGHTQVLKNGKVRLAQEMAALEKDGWLKLISAGFKMLPLLGLKTHGRNIGGTALNTHLLEPLKSLPVAIGDAVLAAGQGRDRASVAVTPRMYWNALRHQKTAGSQEAMEVWRHGARKQDIASGDWQRELNFQKEYIPKPVSDKINQFLNGAGRMLSAEDRFMKSFAIQLALERQAKVQALSEAKHGMIKRSEVRTRMDEIIRKPSHEIEMNAILYGDMVTYNAKNRLAAGINMLKGNLPQAVQTFGIDHILRYVRTPLNVAKIALDINPVIGPIESVVKAQMMKGQIRTAKRALKRDMTGEGALEAEGIALREKEIADLTKRLTPEVHKAYAEAIGRGAIGSAITLLGWHLASQGALTGYDLIDTPADRRRRDVTDRPAASMLVGGQWRKISAFAPVVSPLLMGASMYQLWDSDQRRVKANPASAVAKIAYATAGGWMDLPMNTGIKSVSDMFRSPERLDKAGISYLKNLVGGFIPPVVSDINKAVTGGNQKKITGSEIQSRIPGFSSLLPDKEDDFAQTTPIKRSVFFDPFDSQAPRTDPLSNELDRMKVGVTGPVQGTIYTLTSNGQTMEFETESEMKNAADELTHAGQPFKLGAYEEPEDRFLARHHIVGTLKRELGKVAISQPEYTQMTDNEKRKEIERAFSEATREMAAIMRDPEFASLPKPEQINLLNTIIKLLPVQESK